MRIAVVALSLLLVAAQHPSKATRIPDFLQTDREAGFANRGSQYCAPTAVSNSLMWLAANGYTDLRPKGTARQAQIAMIRALAGPEYMHTSPSTGTNSAQLMRGVAAYVTEAGYGIAELSYEGWRKVPEEQAYSEFPDLEDIRTAMDDEQSAVWLNVGWYTYDEDSGDYERVGGHWVTVVGTAGDELLIHDPAPGAGTGFRTQRISLEELTEGRLTGRESNLPRSAEGYYEVGGEMAVAPGKTCILDGAVFLRLE
jgi:hypothetical protein